MNMTTLEYFVALAQAPSINQAAQQLYISQSSLTRAIQSMEKAMNVIVKIAELAAAHK